jgi:hypothetical protein
MGGRPAPNPPFARPASLPEQCFQESISTQTLRMRIVKRMQCRARSGATLFAMYAGQHGRQNPEEGAMDERKRDSMIAYLRRRLTRIFVLARREVSGEGAERQSGDNLERLSAMYPAWSAMRCDERESALAERLRRDVTAAQRQRGIQAELPRGSLRITSSIYPLPGSGSRANSCSGSSASNSSAVVRTLHPRATWPPNT